MKIPLPFDEENRLRTMRSYKILDTPPEEQFDKIVAQAAFQCNVPIATFTIIDETRAWFKSQMGLGLQEIDRENSFCTLTVANNAPLVIEDTHQDKRFSDNEFVIGPPYIRFYAGVPIRGRGNQPLGSLCIIDRAPRSLPWQDFRLLQKLASQIEEQLSLRYVS